MKIKKLTIIAYVFATVCLLSICLFCITESSFSNDKLEYITSGDFSLLVVEIREEKNIVESQALLKQMNDGKNSVRDFFVEQSNGKLNVETCMISLSLDEESSALLQDGKLDEEKTLKYLSQNLDIQEYDSLKNRNFDVNGDGYFDGIMIYTDVDFCFTENAHVVDYSNSIKTLAIKNGDESFKFGNVMFLNDNQINKNGVYLTSLICHEFGHILGLNDYYGKGSETKYLGGFCLMGETMTKQPTSISTYVKYKYTDWLSELKIKTIEKSSELRFDESADVFRIEISNKAYLWIEEYDPQKQYQYVPLDADKRGVLVYLINGNEQRDGNFDNRAELQLLTIEEGDILSAVVSDDKLAIDIQSICDKNNVKYNGIYKRITISHSLNKDKVSVIIE